MGKKERFSIKVNGKTQTGNGAAVLAALIASPFATDTAEITTAVLENEKFLAVLSLITDIVYEDNAKTITTSGRALLDTLPSLAEYHQRAAELAELRKKLNSFRRIQWKKKRGRKGDDPSEMDISLDL